MTYPRYAQNRAAMVRWAHARRLLRAGVVLGTDDAFVFEVGS